MLTLGGPEKDRSYNEQITRRAALHDRLCSGDDSIGAVTRQRLFRLLNEVVRRSPFYRTDRYLSIISDLDDSGLGDDTLAAIPLLEKDQLARWSHQFSTSVDVADYFQVQTAGSTGVPLKMYFDQGYFISYYAQFLHLLKNLGLRPEPFSVSMMTLSVFKHIPSYRILQPVVNNTYAHRTNISLENWASAGELLSFIAEKSPLILRAMPSTFDKLLEHLDRLGTAPPFKPEAVISIAETLLDTTRERLHAAFGVPVLDEYGLTEVGGIVARECPPGPAGGRSQTAVNGTSTARNPSKKQEPALVPRRGYHINAVDFLVEVIDEAGRPVPDGRPGEIVITNLYSEPIPLVRCRTGDFGVITRQPCGCGRHGPRISRLEGRQLTRFVKPDGRTYNPFDAYRKYLFSLGLIQFQMVQEAHSGLVLNYRADQDVSGSPAVKSLGKAVRELHGSELVLEGCGRESFDRDCKLQSFLCKCAQQRRRVRAP